MRRRVRVEARRRGLPVRRKESRHKTLAIQLDAARQVDDDLKPLVESAARLAGTAERIDQSRRIEGQDADRARRR